MKLTTSATQEPTVPERHRRADRRDLMVTSAVGMAFLASRFFFGQFLLGEFMAFMVLGIALSGAFFSGRSPGVKAPSLRAVLTVVVIQLIGILILMVALYYEYHHTLNHIRSWSPFVSTLALAPVITGVVVVYDRWSKERGGTGVF
jgi:hypothetical protein